MHRKLVADMHLLRLQQDMTKGKRVFSASALLSALEDCDEATEVVWHELAHTLRENINVEEQKDEVPRPIVGLTLAQVSATYISRQKRLLQFFHIAPKASPGTYPQATSS
jgi:hypothetical protein